MCLFSFFFLLDIAPCLSNGMANEKQKHLPLVDQRRVLNPFQENWLRTFLLVFPIVNVLLLNYNNMDDHLLSHVFAIHFYFLLEHHLNYYIYNLQILHLMAFDYLEKYIYSLKLQLLYMPQTFARM